MRLPAFQDLSKEQDEINNLPLDGNHLVTGPPGTGKTVMALYRAQILHIGGRPSNLLMFSNVLAQYTKLAAETLELDGTVRTFHSWFEGLWRKHYGGQPPVAKPADRWSYDWAQILSRFLADPPPANLLGDLLLDEGQDVPPEFYGLARYLARHATVFADENQKLYAHNSTLKEIRSNLGRDVTEHRLTRNYRNSREIALLAKHYYCGAPTGVPELPSRRGPKPTLTRYGKLNDFVEYLARYEATFSDKQIGVACYRSKLQKKLMSRLATKGTTHAPETYISREADHRKVRFDTPGIKILNYQSIKGLEFDTLFVPELQEYSQDPSASAPRMLFYVLVSRARDELHLSCSGEGPEPPLVADVPTDLLERR
jgi:superfamily I DNA/RNA helicase